MTSEFTGDGFSSRIPSGGQLGPGWSGGHVPERSTSRRQDAGPEYSITEIAEASGLTARALRLYEELGILVPRRTPANYRLYVGDMLARARTIADLRAGGVGLADIRAAYHSKTIGDFHERLTLAVQDRLAAIENQRSRLSSLLPSLTSPPSKAP